MNSHRQSLQAMIYKYSQNVIYFLASNDDKAKK